MSAVKRAKEDLERGDFGLAKQRLISYANTTDYDPVLLAQIGRICQDMRDPFEAGRYWFLSSAEGEDVETAIRVYLERTGPDAPSIARHLPRAARLADIDQYPALVRKRIASYGLADAVKRSARPPGPTVRPPGVWVTVAVVLVTLIMLAVTITGIWTIAEWIIR